MKKIIKWISGVSLGDASAKSVYSQIWSIVLIFSTLVTVILWIYLKCNLASGLTTFLLVAGASFAGGAAIGFLFGLPRSEKYRFLKKEDLDNSTRDFSYADNTNLEEVSDWLTKIIVGLSLVKFRLIISWLDQSAKSIDAVFKSGCLDPKNGLIPLNGYVFGYCAIIFYFLIGAGLCYLWARTNLSLILTKTKKDQLDIEKQKNLVAQLQRFANPELDSTLGLLTDVKLSLSEKNQNSKLEPSNEFRNKVESIYNSKPIIDDTDIQRGRWGGLFQRGNYIFESSLIESISPSLFRIRLSVRSNNLETPLKGEVAFFLHDTFPTEIIYAIANNNKAEISISTYEAFVAGAILEDGTELELDLNKVTGFPVNFYWGK